MRVRVLVERRLPQNAAALELLENDGVCFLHEHPANERHLGRELATEIHGLQERKSIPLSRRVIVRTERGAPCARRRYLRRRTRRTRR